MAKQESVPARLATLGSKTTAFGRAMLPYFVAVVIACAAMAWYFFIFVPSHLHYFVGARFRTLAVASGQISGKIENLQRALNGAAASVKADQFLSAREREALTSYLETLVPVMQPNPAGRLPLPGLALSTGQSDDYTVTVAWRDVVEQAAAASFRDFDDLLLANENGDVVWQREDATPRVANIGELLNAEVPASGWLPASVSWAVTTTAPSKEKKDASIPESAVMKSVNLNGRSSYLLIQAINPGKKFYVAGFVPTATVQRQAMHLPTARVVFFAVPLCLLFLSLPFVKLATLTSRERYGFADVALLAVAAILATGIGTIFFFVPSLTNSSRDEQLAQFGRQIETNLVEETNKILTLAQGLQKLKDSGKFENRGTPEDKGNESKLIDCKVTVPAIKQRCGLWETLDNIKKKPSAEAIWDQEPGSMELDVVVWIAPDGHQRMKWTTKQQVTGETSHRPFDHYRDLQARRTWRLRESGFKRFTIDPLRSPTTSEMAIAFALDADRGEDNLMLNVRPQSVVDPLVPPGYGFAIIAPTGKVLFHSEEGLSLQENFFEEVGDRDDVRASAQIEREFTWSGDYHGRLHRLHMRPFGEFMGSPWRIVTFQQLEPHYAAEFRRQSGVFRFSLINLVLLTATALACWWFARKRNIEVRNTLMSEFAFLSAKTILARERAIRYLAALAVAGAGAFALTYTPWGKHWNVFALIFLALPMATIALSVLARSRWGAGKVGTTKEKEKGIANPTRRLALELSLLLLLIGVIPAAGFARIVHRFEKQQETQIWLLEVQQQWLARAQRTLERANGSTYSKGTINLLTQKSGFAANWSSETPSYSYLNLVQGFGMHEPVPVKSAAKAESQTPPKAPRDFVRWLLRLLEPKDRMSARSKFASDGNILQLKPDSGTDAPVEAPDPAPAPVPAPIVAPVLAADYVGTPGEDFSLLKGGAGLAILLGVFFSVYWATRKLAVPPASGAASLKKQVEAIPLQGSHGILVIGPPLRKKDQAVQEAFREAAKAAEVPKPAQAAMAAGAAMAAELPKPAEAAMAAGAAMAAELPKPAEATMAAGAAMAVELPKPAEAAMAAKVLPKRIPLLDLSLTDAAISDLVKQCARLSATGGESVADRHGRIWLHLSNLESQLATVEARAQVLKLLEKLLDQTLKGPPRVLVVTSSVDPIANFREIFEQERRNIYQDSMPEVELSQSALVLSRFRRCYLPLEKPETNAAGRSEVSRARVVESQETPKVQERLEVWNSWRSYNPARWNDTAILELEKCEPLAHLLGELQFLWGDKPYVARETLARTIQSKARAYYELLWTSCTRTEKLVLVQLAQEGFVNPKSRDVVAQLIAKGLLIEQPKPAVFNYTFREFLRGSERNSVVQEWEQMEGTGMWFVSGRLIAGGLILGGVFYLLTQDFSFQSLLPIISGTGVFGIPIVRDLVARFSGRSPASTA